jgi:hypothetical protein
MRRFGPWMVVSDQPAPPPSVKISAHQRQELPFPIPGVRGHVRALFRGDMSPRNKAASCRRTPYLPLRPRPSFRNLRRSPIRAGRGRFFGAASSARKLRGDAEHSKGAAPREGISFLGSGREGAVSRSCFVRAKLRGARSTPRGLRPGREFRSLGPPRSFSSGGRHRA